MNIPQKSLIIGKARDQELLSAATTYLYKQCPAGDLLAHFFFPHDFNYETDRRPVAIFFHGGLWDLAAPTQFVPHCHHFTTRGMVAVTVEYRNKAHLDGTPEDAIADVKDAIGFIKHHALGMGLDPEKIITIGAGAGGNAVLASALHPHLNAELPAPNPAAMILFGPLSDTTTKGVGNELFETSKIGKELSPSSHLPQKDLPPCLIFHGTADRVVPYEQSERFVKKYRRRKNNCELMAFEKVGHTFFNYNSDQTNYELTLRAADHFLVELGLLEPDPLGDIMH